MQRSRYQTKPASSEPRENPVFELNVRQWASSSGVDNSKTHVSEPVEITSFSRGSNREIKYGSREQLLTFTEPTLNVNLGEGIETYRPKTEDDVGVEPVLEALQAHGFDIDGQADVITYRNNLNKIAGAPYNNRDDWEFDCARVGRTVYLDVRKLDEGPVDERQKRFMYYGYRFEALCTGTAHEPVDANSEFCSVVRLRLANHRILLSAEIDCTMQDSHGSSNPLTGYVELKTMKEMHSERELDNMHKHRFLKYWIQSYLAGVRKIAIGTRTEDGELLEVKRIDTHALPRMVRHHFDSKRSPGQWSPFVCINFVDCVLASIRRACAERPGSTIRVRYNSRRGVLSGVVVASPDEGLNARIRPLRKA